MTALIIILLVGLIAYFLFTQKRNKGSALPIAAPTKDLAPVSTIEEEPTLTDEFGRKYKAVEKTREIPRKTYLYGSLHGKYWGELDELKQQTYQHSKFYHFNIYEIEVSNVRHQLTPFDITPDSHFPRELLPSLIPVILTKQGREYALNIQEPQITNVKLNRKLHQDEGNEVFGTIDADITGYVLDFITETYFERDYLPEYKSEPSPEAVTKSQQTHIPTGHVEHNGDYKRIEFYYADFKNKYWGPWTYTKPSGTGVQEGCLSAGLGLVGTLLGAAVFVLLLPNLAILLPFVLIVLVLRLIPASAWTWIIRLLGGLIALACMAVLLHSIHFNHGSNPQPVVQKEPEERRAQKIPIVDSSQGRQNQDSLIMHYRKWNDYNGHYYEGNYWVKQSSFYQAKTYKNNLPASELSENSYDKILFLLKENDKQHLAGVYALFDSLKVAQKLNDQLFAEMIVCFVQSIPYAVVLPDACDPNLYADQFIKTYLLSAEAKCDGYEKFGINTPVEFMATSKGDCDTRTLFLYTILTHYNYDVALLSSEFYNHSLLGIDLPYEGAYYSYNNQRYILWETTNANFKPGMLPNQISNTKYWRISLKSK